MTAPSDPLVGTVVAGRYRVIQLLGKGGMGAVCLAEHAAIEKKVALKAGTLSRRHARSITSTKTCRPARSGCARWKSMASRSCDRVSEPGQNETIVIAEARK
jgi:serine/threonine protein kinase